MKTSLTVLLAVCLLGASSAQKKCQLPIVVDVTRVVSLSCIGTLKIFAVGGGGGYTDYYGAGGGSGNISEHTAILVGKQSNLHITIGEGGGRNSNGGETRILVLTGNNSNHFSAAGGEKGRHGCIGGNGYSGGGGVGPGGANGGGGNGGHSGRNGVSPGSCADGCTEGCNGGLGNRFSLPTPQDVNIRPARAGVSGGGRRASGIGGPSGREPAMGRPGVRRRGYSGGEGGGGGGVNINRGPAPRKDPKNGQGYGGGAGGGRGGQGGDGVVVIYRK